MTSTFSKLRPAIFYGFYTTQKAKKSASWKGKANVTTVWVSLIYWNYHWDSKVVVSTALSELKSTIFDGSYQYLQKNEQKIRVEVVKKRKLVFSLHLLEMSILFQISTIFFLSSDPPFFMGFETRNKKHWPFHRQK